MNKIIDLDKFNHYKTVKTIDEQYISVNPYDIYIGNNLIKNGIWEMHVNNLLKAICKENMTVIDIGANIGTHTILMSKLVGEKGNVYAFEPSKNHIEILFYNLMINNCYNTKIYGYGCGDKHENMYVDQRFLDTKTRENFGAIELKKEFSVNDEEIEIRSIDSFDFPKIDIVKIDSERMENMVINGMKNTISKYRPIIIIEIHDEDVDNMKNIFESINYSLQRLKYTCDFLAIPN